MWKGKLNDTCTIDGKHYYGAFCNSDIHIRKGQEYRRNRIRIANADRKCIELSARIEGDCMKLIDAKHLLQKIHSHTNMYGWGHGSLAIERKLTELIDGEDTVTGTRSGQRIL